MKAKARKQPATAAAGAAIYQVNLPLEEFEFAALEADIIARGGVHTPGLKDQHGNILDGFHRDAICRKHGLEMQWKQVSIGDPIEGRTLARRLNLGAKGRHVSQAADGEGARLAVDHRAARSGGVAGGFARAGVPGDGHRGECGA